MIFPAKKKKTPQLQGSPGLEKKPSHDSSQVALHAVHDERHPAIFTGASVKKSCARQRHGRAASQKWKKCTIKKYPKLGVWWDLMEIQTFWAFLISGISFKADAAEKKSFFLKMRLFNLMLLGAQRMHSLIRLYVTSGRGLCVSIYGDTGARSSIIRCHFDDHSRVDAQRSQSKDIGTWQ